MAEVSHLRGDVSGESLVRIDECSSTGELSGDEMCCYGARRWLACPAGQLVDSLPCSSA